MLDAANARLPELVAQVYARTFTVNELHEIQAFYVAPTGQKLRQNLVVITQETTVSGNSSARASRLTYYTRISDELRKRGHDIPARASQPPKPPTTAPTISNTPSQ